MIFLKIELYYNHEVENGSQLGLNIRNKIMKLYLNGKKISQKAAKEMLGEERYKRMLKEAKEAFREDPFEKISFFVGKGMLNFEF